MEKIKKSFKSYGLNLATDGSEDNLFHCFNEALQSQQINFTKPTVNSDQKNVKLFETDESDVAVVTPEFVIVDSDHDHDNDIDIM